MNLRDLKREVAALTGHDLDQTNVTQIELTAHGVDVHVAEVQELQDSLKEAIAELVQLRGDVRRWLGHHEVTKAIRELERLVAG